MNICIQHEATINEKRTGNRTRRGIWEGWEEEKGKENSLNDNLKNKKKQSLSVYHRWQRLPHYKDRTMNTILGIQSFSCHEKIMTFLPKFPLLGHWCEWVFASSSVYLSLLRACNSIWAAGFEKLLSRFTTFIIYVYMCVSVCLCDMCGCSQTHWKSRKGWTSPNEVKF